MQALFKARFEQALESQKLNIKKLEQQLRRNGINPEDPVATASIQRVASSFFNAIDKKEGTPYVFHEDKFSVTEPSNNFEPSEPSDEKEQEELDKFIAEIEDAAEREWAAEEAAEKEDFGRLRYWNREEFGGRFRRAETFRGDDSYDEIKGARSWKDKRGKARTNESDDDASDADDEWRSHNATGARPVNSETDESDESEENFKVRRGGRGNQEKIGRPRNNEVYKRNAPVNLRKSMPEEDSNAENEFSDLETAMWQSDADEEQDSSTARARNYNYRSDSDEEEESYKNEDRLRSTGTNLRRKWKEEDSGETCTHPENAWLEAEAEEYSEASGADRSSGDEEYQVKRDYKDKTDTKRTRTAKEMDETWDSD